MNALIYFAGIVFFAVAGLFSATRVTESPPLSQAPSESSVVSEGSPSREEMVKTPSLAPVPTKVADTPTKQPHDRAPTPAHAVIQNENPLRQEHTAIAFEDTAAITPRGIIVATNRERAARGLSPLAYDEGLRRVATMKLADMFALNYFEHTSPTGVDLAGLAARADYDYLIIGENLAYGDGFSSAQDIVDAWMNSPGHKANILDTRYTAIGVAVAFGPFKGRNAWVAVQEFSVPASACERPASSLRDTIEQQQSAIESLRVLLKALEQTLHQTPRSSPSYGMHVEEYNALVSSYNALIKEHAANVSLYNRNVTRYRECFDRLR